MDVVLSLIGVVIGAALSMFADTRHERRADRVRRYEAAKSIGKDIAEVMNVLDAARLKVWEAQRHGGESVPDHVAVSAFAEFRDSLPRLLLAVRMARAEPLTPSAIEALQRFDSELGRLPERPDNFHMLGVRTATTRLGGISLREVTVNGQPGAMVFDPSERLIGVLALDIAEGGQIQTVTSVINPDKLTHLGPLADLGPLSGRGRRGGEERLPGTSSRHHIGG